MAICNRDLDATEQKHPFNASISASTGVATTHLIAQVPYPSNLVVARGTATGTTGTPVVNFVVRRNLSAGLTAIVNVLGATLALPAATGPLGASLFTGASAFQLQAGDLIYANVDGITGAALQLVLQATQDFKTFYGV